jgi:hypothetical protein
MDMVFSYEFALRALPFFQKSPEDEYFWRDKSTGITFGVAVPDPYAIHRLSRY